MGRTIVFFPEGAYGPTNNCVGIGDVLRRRGHRVVFIVEESFAGALEAQGFEEALMRLGPPPETQEVPGQFWKDFIRDTAPMFRRPTIEQLEGFIQPTWQALVDGARYVDPRLREILEALDPDVVVEDNVVAFPALAASGRPWVRIMSCNPAELKDADVPPTFSGYPTRDRSGWDTFRAEYDRTHRPLWAEFDEFVREAGAPPLPDLEFIHESPWLDLYVYPAEVDYARARPLQPTWHRIESSVRATDAPWSPPEGFLEDGQRLVYLSLGSLGSADVELMQTLISELCETPHRFVVSKGPQHELYDLPESMIGEEFLPQTRVLPHVDAVITHGGNNTVTECFHFGKPMLVLPLFWDQYDNAQRVDELGFGVRISTYGHGPDELRRALDHVLADDALHARIRAVADRLQETSGTARAADLIERVATTGEPARRG
jgi:MGT family glycosyltransferase